MKISPVFFAALVLLISSMASPVFAATDSCAVFTRNLRYGMKGDDVLLLQRVLNHDPRTVVATEGPGSLRNETNFFGALTMQAVIKFQELYFNEVLKPVGLTSGSGFVGTFSRAKFAALCASEGIASAGVGTSVASSPVPSPSPAVTPAPVIPSTPSPAPVSSTTPSPSPLPGAIATDLSMLNTANIKSDTPLIVEPSSYAIAPGGTLAIAAAGLLDKNDVHLGSKVFSGITPNASGTLTIIVPSDMPTGSQDLWITNAKGESNKTFIVVSNGSSSGPPVVVSFTPKSGFDGTEVTVTGLNFTPTNNTIRGGSTDITGLSSSDGKTLKFSVSLDIPGVTPGEDVPGVDVTFPYWFYVVNANGISGPSVFNIKY